MVDFQCKNRYGWEDLLKVMAILRAPGGCPWDAEQTHASIRRDLLEETWEVADALDRNDPEAMCEELGDLLLQVVFHAQIETEAGRFNIDDVIHGITAKMVYRHPHVFGGTMEADTSEEVLVNWEILKRQEKDQRSTADAIEAVPHTLPALWRAEKVQKKTSKAGFTWSNSLDVLTKLEEEVRELRLAMEEGRVDGAHGIREEIGDTLFIAAKAAQVSGVDPEDALHRACDKFDRRFRLVEESAAGKPLADFTEEELIALWKAAKATES